MQTSLDRPIMANTHRPENIPTTHARPITSQPLDGILSGMVAAQPERIP